VELAHEAKVLSSAAVDAQHGVVATEERIAAVRELGGLALPVDAPAAMKAESDPFGGEPPTPTGSPR